MGQKLRLTATVTAAGLAAGYAAGQSIGAGPISLSLPAGVGRCGRLLDCHVGVTPASGNLVTTGLVGNVWVFRSINAPAAVADAAALDLTAANQTLAVARYNFVAANWLGPTGTTAAGASGAQGMVEAEKGNEGAFFDFAPDALLFTAVPTFSVFVQAGGTWDPGGAGTIAQTVIVHFDVELD